MINKMIIQLKIILLACCLFIFTVPSFAYTAQRSVDDRDFDIAGVKTGMGWDEALAAAAKHFQTMPNEFIPEKWPNSNSFIALITGVNYPSYFTYKRDGVELAVYFAARIPADQASPLTVYSIIYQIPYSQINSDKMKKAALAKYGKQSNAPNDLPMQWCVRPNSNPGMGCDDRGQSVLKLSQVELRLTDYQWQDAQNKFMDEKKTRVPGF